MILVVDYGMGNLRSVSKALEHLKAEVLVSSNPADFKKAEKLVVPGVGAFGDAAKELSRLKLDRAVKDFIESGKACLGICLGLQLLFESSEENPGAKGLGVFPGKVRQISSKQVKVPHMGWNQMELRQTHPLLNGVADQSYFYFVHSFYAVPENEELIAGSCEYGGESLTAAVARENVFATQFHPEKSQQAGLMILKNFLAWTASG